MHGTLISREGIGDWADVIGIQGWKSRLGIPTNIQGLVGESWFSLGIVWPAEKHELI